MAILIQLISEFEIEPMGFEAFLQFVKKIGIRLIIDLATMFILVKLIYYRIYKQQEFFFMFVIFNLIIFLITFLLNKVDLSLGAAFGLFAVFSMLRYRTESISIKEMTYLFLCIAIGLLTAITKIKNASDYYEHLFILGLNSCILIVTWLLETNVFVRKENSKIISYANLPLIDPQLKQELLEDLKSKTGIRIHRFNIEEINLAKGYVKIKVFYYES